ncbi:biotin/lipoyl-binding protein [candidate division KSB1 bacterium]|nr:biotin/lipoyl-binding protein [candidate division KSB1 bacterium]
MKKIIIALIVILVLVVVMSTILVSLDKSSQPPQISTPPQLPQSPARVYGIVEPFGREVFLAPPLSRTVEDIFVSEGDTVKTGQPICQLECKLEKAALEISESRLQEIRAKIAITEDNLGRKSTLYQGKAIAEFDYENMRLQLNYEKTLLETAKAELERAKTQVNRLLLKSPINGIVYKIDLRFGELFTPQDYKRVIIGNRQLQVRMFVEAFWRDRFKMAEKVEFKDAETLDRLGEGRIIAVSPYMGARDFRTEDPLERIDVKYQQVIVKADSGLTAPLGLLLQCELGQ